MSFSKNKKMLLPNFIIAGTQKGGTTTIFSVLKRHPEVFVPTNKEVHFFDRDEAFSKGLQYYEKFFKKAENKKAIIDITPNYMYVPDVPERIFKIMPHVKIIFALRDPIKRAYSHYWQNVRAQVECKSFEEAIRGKGNQYVEKSLYYKHIKRFLEYFGKKDIYIFISEEMFNDPIIFFKKFFKILGIQFIKDIDFNKKENVARVPRLKKLERIMLSQNFIIRRLRKITPNKVKVLMKRIDEKFNMKKIIIPPLDNEVKTYLIKKMGEDIFKLEKEFKIDLSLWRNFE